MLTRNKWETLITTLTKIAEIPNIREIAVSTLELVKKEQAEYSLREKEVELNIFKALSSIELALEHALEKIDINQKTLAITLSGFLADIQTITEELIESAGIRIRKKEAAPLPIVDRKKENFTQRCQKLEADLIANALQLVQKEIKKQVFPGNVESNLDDLLELEIFANASHFVENLKKSFQQLLVEKVQILKKEAEEKNYSMDLIPTVEKTLAKVVQQGNDVYIEQANPIYTQINFLWDQFFQNEFETVQTQAIFDLDDSTTESHFHKLLRKQKEHEEYLKEKIKREIHSVRAKQINSMLDAQANICKEAILKNKMAQAELAREDSEEEQVQEEKKHEVLQQPLASLDEKESVIEAKPIVFASQILPPSGEAKHAPEVIRLEPTLADIIKAYKKDKQGFHRQYAPNKSDMLNELLSQVCDLNRRGQNDRAIVLFEIYKRFKKVDFASIHSVENCWQYISDQLDYLNQFDKKYCLSNHVISVGKFFAEINHGLQSLFSSPQYSETYSKTRILAGKLMDHITKQHAIEANRRGFCK